MSAVALVQCDTIDFKWHAVRSKRFPFATADVPMEMCLRCCEQLLSWNSTEHSIEFEKFQKTQINCYCRLRHYIFIVYLSHRIRFAKAEELKIDFSLSPSLAPTLSAAHPFESICVRLFSEDAYLHSICTFLLENQNQQQCHAQFALNFQPAHIFLHESFRSVWPIAVYLRSIPIDFDGLSRGYL